MSPAASERGRLPIPDLDDRRWQDLVEEATALIDRYAPQWTDRSPSDLGMTLIELFAWLVEGLIYKLNRVPEKNHIAFLSMLGITRDPPAPARTLLTFAAQAGTAATAPEGARAQTQGSESEPPVVFETEADLHVVPGTVEVARRIDVPPDSPQPRTTDVTDVLLSPRVGEVALELAPRGRTQISLGFDAAFSADVDHLDLHVELGSQSLAGAGQAPAPGPRPAGLDARWVYSTAAHTNPLEWSPLDVETDGTAGLRRDGQVRLRVPSTAGWEAQNPAWPPAEHGQLPTITGPRRWIGLRLDNPTTQRLTLELRCLLVNTVPASTALTVRSSAPDELGQGTGAPSQVFKLRNWPLFERPGADAPFDHLTVTVDDEPWTLLDDDRWTRLDELPADRRHYYRLDSATGEILFGTNDPDVAQRPVPARGSRIVATYRYVATGEAGNVQAGMVTALGESIPGVMAVTNPVPGAGGRDEEAIERTMLRAPRLLRTRDRAVTAEDYEFLTRQESREIAIVRCLPPRLQDEDRDLDPGPQGGAAFPGWGKGDPWQFADLYRAPGNVNVIIVPDLGIENPRPEPALSHVHEVLRALDQRRDVTVLLRVTGPRYLPINVTVDARVFRRAITDGLIRDAQQAYDEIRRKLGQFFHPVHGHGGRGWQVGESVYVADVYQAIRPSDEIGYIAELTLAPAIPLYHSPPLGPGGRWSRNERPIELPLEASGPVVRLADYELVCFGSSDISPHEPE